MGKGRGMTSGGTFEEKAAELSFSCKENTQNLIQSPCSDKTGIKDASTGPNSSFYSQHDNHGAEWI